LTHALAHTASEAAHEKVVFSKSAADALSWLLKLLPKTLDSAPLM
jgi:hypothetical protein